MTYFPNQTGFLTKRIDFVGDSVIYIGESQPGTLESAAMWKIVKITIGTDGDITEIFAEGTNSFQHKWSDRLTLNYS